MIVYGAMLCILVMMNGALFSMDFVKRAGSLGSLHKSEEKLCNKERVVSYKGDKFVFTWFTCLQKKSICKQETSCCYQDKTCCYGITGCCKKNDRNCCGDITCSCTTGGKIAFISYKLLSPVKIIEMRGVDDRMFIEWIEKQAKSDQRFLHARDLTEETALYLAAQMGDLDLCRKLLIVGANVNIATPKTRFTPLHKAKTVEIVELLLAQANINIEYEDNLGNTPLFTQIADEKKMKLLLKCGANINHQNRIGNTVLHIAGNIDLPIDMINFLLSNGANYMLVNNIGALSIEYMSDQNVKAFKKYGLTMFPLVRWYLGNDAKELRKAINGATNKKKCIKQLRPIFNNFIQACFVRDAHLSQENIQKQQLIQSGRDIWGLVGVYCTYEKLCSYCGKDIVDYVCTLFKEKKKK